MAQAKTAKAGIFFAFFAPLRENIRHVKLREVRCSEILHDPKVVEGCNAVEKPAGLQYE